jgi:transcriptional regulator with XRE-family HTH domain
MKAEKTQKEIAAVLGVSQGTMSKECNSLADFRSGRIAEKLALDFRKMWSACKS